MYHAPTCMCWAYELNLCHIHIYSSSICGDSYQRTTQSLWNSMMVTYNTFDVDLGSHFTATASLIYRKYLICISISHHIELAIPPECWNTFHNRLSRIVPHVTYNLSASPTPAVAAPCLAQWRILTRCIAVVCCRVKRCPWISDPVASPVCVPDQSLPPNATESNVSELIVNTKMSVNLL